MSASALIAASSMVLLLTRRAPVPHPEAAPRVIAHLTSPSSEVRRRAAHTLLWETLAPGSEVRDQDTVFVPPQADAEISFLDGTRLELDENSLVLLEAPTDATPSVALQQGSLLGHTKAGTLKIRSEGGSTALKGNSVARVDLEDLGPQVEVLSGQAGLATSQGERPLAAHQRASSKGGGRWQVGAAPSLELRAPERNARLPFHGTPEAVTISWRPDDASSARLQVARDRTFGFVVLQINALEGQARLEHPDPGVYWWRLVDPQGRALSEARRFTLVEDLPPRPLIPKGAQVVLSTEQSPIQFAWTQVRGASGYRLEVAADEGFTTVAHSAPSGRPGLSSHLPLPEGTYYWRVRAEDSSRAGSPSRALPFRLIHKALPEAPELLSPEIEVGPGAPAR